MKQVWLLLLALMVVVGGCSAEKGTSSNVKGDSGSTDVTAANSSQKVDISLLVSTASGGGWPVDHPMITYLNDKFNVNLKFEWVPGDSYTEKLNVLAASGQFPDVFTVGDTEYAKWQSKGVFLDLKPLLNSYQHIIGNTPEEALTMMNPKDHIYGLPLYAPAFRSNLAIRQDWLDKLGLQAPTTVDEFYEVAKAFVENDPDGNGRQDTIGFSMSVGNGLNTIGYLMGAFGLPNEWGIKDGKLLPQQVYAEEWKELAAYLNKAYTEGVLDKDFAINKGRDPWSKLEANTSGIAEVNPNEVYTNSLPTLQKLAPEAEIVQLAPPKGPNGLQFASTIYGTAKIVLNSKMDIEKQKRILQIIDFIFSDEGYILTKNGIEGIHYEKQGDKYVKLPAFDTDRPQILSTWFIRRFDPSIQIRLWDDEEYKNKVLNWFNNTEKYRWVNSAAGLVSETDSKLGADLDTKLTTAIVNVIIGKKPLDSIDEAIADWRSSGGDKIIEETNAIYTELQK